MAEISDASRAMSENRGRFSVQDEPGGTRARVIEISYDPPGTKVLSDWMERSDAMALRERLFRGESA